MLFERRHDWFNHIMTAHKTEITISDTAEVMEDTNPAQAFIRGVNSNGSEITVDSTGDVSSSSSFYCPLCHSIYRPISVFEKHLARHMGELSLFALPSQEGGMELDEEQDAQATDSDSPSESKKPPTGEAEHSAPDIQDLQSEPEVTPATSQTYFASMKPAARYICCKCGDGPKVYYDHQPLCINCNHVVCENCESVR